LDNNIFKENYLECIVEFAYTGKVRIDSEIVQDLLVAASFLQIEFIQTQCENFMAKKIDMDYFLNKFRYNSVSEISLLDTDNTEIHAYQF
jgi:hypothetical protein